MLVAIKKFYNIEDAGRICMYRQLEIEEEIAIPDRRYPLPKYEKPKAKYQWTPAGAVGFIKNYVGMLIP